MLAKMKKKISSLIPLATPAPQSAAGQGASTVCMLSERVWSRKHPLWELGWFFIFWVLLVTSLHQQLVLTSAVIRLDVLRRTRKYK